MPRFIARCRTRDFSAWKDAYEQGAPQRQAMGVERQQILRSVDDPNEFLLLIETDDLDRVRRDMESDEFRARIARSGVIERIVYFPEA